MFSDVILVNSDAVILMMSVVVVLLVVVILVCRSSGDEVLLVLLVLLIVLLVIVDILALVSQNYVAYAYLQFLRRLYTVHCCLAVQEVYARNSRY